MILIFALNVNNIWNSLFYVELKVPILYKLTNFAFLLTKAHKTAL